METFEHFYNNTLPIIINVINAQSNELIIQRYLIYGLVGILTLIGVAWILKKILLRYFRLEIRRRNV